MKKSYYSRHNLPGGGAHPNDMKVAKPSMAALINRKFYQNLIARGRSNQYIFDMIQPERREQFFKDVNSRFSFSTKKKDIKPKLSWAQKLLKSVF